MPVISRGLVQWSGRVRGWWERVESMGVVHELDCGQRVGLDPVIRGLRRIVAFDSHAAGSVVSSAAHVRALTSACRPNGWWLDGAVVGAATDVLHRARRVRAGAGVVGGARAMTAEYACRPRRRTRWPAVTATPRAAAGSASAPAGARLLGRTAAPLRREMIGTDLPLALCATGWPVV